MTTAAERLVALAGSTGSAGALLLMIGSGATAGAALVDYSGLASDTAGNHLLTDRDQPQPEPGFGAVHRPYVKRRPREEDEALLLAVLH
jgi:hypothetical protein